MTLRPATTDDLGFVRALTRRPDYRAFITDEDEAALAAYLDAPDDSLLIHDDPRGFALFCGIGDPSGTVELRRLALDRTGSGRGAAFIAELVDHAFARLGAERLWLDASGENPRALALYERAGFTREGLLRRHWWRPSLCRAVDMHLFGMLRPEWAAMRATR